MNGKSSSAITALGAYAGTHIVHIEPQLHTTGATGGGVPHFLNSLRLCDSPERVGRVWQ